MSSFASVKTLRHQINLFLDNELPKDDQANLIQFMENDARSSKIYNNEKDFREFVKNNVKRPSVTPDFVQNLKERIKL
ncbi:MAG: hypothetical protein IPN86_09480 [Saprospiraceae bacterium]|jgi:hypothetical protein|nr:hypothetical protein [Saprospiraceae bacterium]